MDTFRGIYSIAATPFDEWGNLVWDDVERETDWIVRCGTHGLVWPVMASEYTVISFPERVRGMQLVVDTVAGRIPVVIGVADTSKAGAVALAEKAAKAGANAIIAMPPWSTKLESHDLVRDYYRALADAAQLPVIVQNVGPPLGSNLPGRFVVELCREIPLVQYLKEEKNPQGQSLTEVLAFEEPEVKGVFSGSGCIWLISQYKRGICGCMPGPHMTDVDARIWNLLEEGREAEARTVHNAKIVLENALRSMPGRASKEVLRRRGVFTQVASRGGGALALDAHDLAELALVMAHAAPYFAV
ncbi:MAG: dihydrodipicolinate synthase family protein [Anaerolineae bacterium]|nr:dihydrodipicolinate synthase family protein [Anaerolineae bacterium]